MCPEMRCAHNHVQNGMNGKTGWMNKWFRIQYQTIIIENYQNHV